MNDEAKPYTLAQFAADRAHGDLDQDAMRATVEALAAVTRERDEWREVASSWRSAACAVDVGSLRAEVARLTRERDEACDALNRKGMSCTPDLDMMRLTREVLALRAEAERLREERDAAIRGEVQR